MENIKPFRNILLQDYRSISDLPYIYRWLYDVHVQDSISRFEPYTTKYCTYHALPMPEGGEDFGIYKAFMTEHARLIDQNEDRPPEGPPRGVPYAEAYEPEFMIRTRQDANAPLRNPIWMGSKNGFHPVVLTRIPAYWELDLKGKERTLEDGANFRWLIINKYPVEVDEEEGDRWFVGTFLEAFRSIQETTRLLSSRTIETSSRGPWKRLTEIWFDSSDAWLRAIHQAEKRISAPKWKSQEAFPYLSAYDDITGIFITDYPNSNHLTQYRGYEG